MTPCGTPAVEMIEIHGPVRCERVNRGLNQNNGWCANGLPGAPEALPCGLAMMHSSETEAVEAQRGDLTTRLRELAEADKVATPQYRRLSDTHSLLTKLLDGDNTPAEVARRLAELEGR